MNIAFIGMSGAGKSAIGKIIARKLRYKFIDTDKIIERNAKMKAQELLNRVGDKGFLEIEQKTVLGLKKLRNCIIAPGGSVVYLPKAMRFLRKSALIVFLDVKLQDLKRQVSSFSMRGIIGLKKKGLSTLFRERHPLYKKYSHISISLKPNLSLKSQAEMILNKIKSGKKELTDRSF